MDDYVSIPRDSLARLLHLANRIEEARESDNYELLVRETDELKLSLREWLYGYELCTSCHPPHWHVGDETCDAPIRRLIAAAVN